MLLILDDVCKTMHSEGSGLDEKYVKKVQGQLSNPHFMPQGASFTIKHYAGNVTYDADGFCEKNNEGEQLLSQH